VSIDDPEMKEIRVPLRVEVLGKAGRASVRPPADPTR
jgi:hypothetical protein